MIPEKKRDRAAVAREGGNLLERSFHRGEGTHEVVITPSRQRVSGVRQRGSGSRARDAVEGNRKKKA